MTPCGKSIIRQYAQWSILILCFISASAYLLSTKGKGGRKPAPPIPDMRQNFAFVDNPEQAYLRWKTRGEHGRIVVSLSRWLNFVEPVEKLPTDNPVPLRVTNLAKETEKLLSAENFLFMTVRSGIAREIIHVVPESGYAARLDGVKQVEGAIERKHDILVPYIGTPRRITIPTNLVMGNEPVLLYVNASVFSDYEPKELLKLLRHAGLKASEIVLCQSADDTQVTAQEHARLTEFATLLEKTGL